MKWNGLFMSLLRAFIVLCILAAAMFIALEVINPDVDAELGGSRLSSADSITNAASDISGSSVEGSRENLATSKKTEVVDANHDHENDLIDSDQMESLMSNSFQTKKHWFHGADLITTSDGDLRYLADDASLEIDASCANNSAVDSSQTFQGNLAQRYGVDVKDKDVSDTFFKSISHFFQYGDRFFQATLIWDYDMPAVYRIEFFSAADAAFTQDVQTEQSSIPTPDYPDAIASLEWLDTLIANYVSQGALEGQRIVEQRVMDEMGEAHEWVSMNGRVLSWQSGDEATCILDSSGTIGRCICSA